MLGTCLDNVRKTTPLVHNITNYVTVNDVANILLACGASPIMSDEPEDVEDITSICGGLNINIGTLHRTSIDGMYRAGAKAASLGHKILLDPVGAGASHLRTSTAVGLMEKIPFTVIRGNISEIKTLALGSGTTKGVDADVADKVTDENLDSAVAFAKNFAKDHNCVVAITGAIDLVADADTCYVIRNGRAEMGSITGTGCQLSGMMTAYLVANPDEPLKAAAAAVCAMGLAGEIGWSHMKPEDGNSTYRNRIIDAIYHCYVIRNGRAEMGSITGTGCQLSGMMTAYLVANPDEPLKAAAAAVCAMGLAGEIGWSHMKPEDGNSTYRNRIIDAIYHMDGETLEKGAKYEVR